MLSRTNRLPELSQWGSLPCSPSDSQNSWALSCDARARVSPMLNDLFPVGVYASSRAAAARSAGYGEAAPAFRQKGPAAHSRLLFLATRHGRPVAARARGWLDRTWFA